MKRLYKARILETDAIYSCKNRVDRELYLSYVETTSNDRKEGNVGRVKRKWNPRGIICTIVCFIGQPEYA